MVSGGRLIMLDEIAQSIILVPVSDFSLYLFSQSRKINDDYSYPEKYSGDTVSYHIHIYIQTGLDEYQPHAYLFQRDQPRFQEAQATALSLISSHVIIVISPQTLFYLDSWYNAKNSH